MRDGSSIPAGFFWCRPIPFRGAESRHIDGTWKSPTCTAYCGGRRASGQCSLRDGPRVRYVERDGATHYCDAASRRLDRWLVTCPAPPRRRNDFEDHAVADDTRAFMVRNCPPDAHVGPRTPERADETHRAPRAGCSRRRAFDHDQRVTERRGALGLALCALATGRRCPIAETRRRPASVDSARGSERAAWRLSPGRRSSVPQRARP